jgi:NADPH2:quinone reductase
MTVGANAILMREYGSPDVLTYTQVPLPALKADKVRIRSIASAVNHTDLEIRAGNWPIKRAYPFPYIFPASRSLVRSKRRARTYAIFIRAIG